MNYFKDENGQVFAFDNEQVEQGHGEGMTRMSQTEFDEYQESLKPPVDVVAAYTAALESHYDATAQAKKYDNRLTCGLRAGYAGPFQAEGTAFAVWMDTSNAYAYEQFDLVELGERELPTIDEMIAELPEMVWS